MDSVKRKNYGSPEEDAFIAVMRAAEALQWSVTELLKKYGLSPTQYNALRILRGAGSDGLACSEIADRMINRDPDITRLLNRLQRMGLIQRGHDKSDKRVILASITRDGLELLRKVDQPLDRLHRKRLEHLGPRRLKSLIGMLKLASKKFA
ncbi:MAG: MarR family transcriptional regulator [Terriglobales bacterium]